MILIFFHFKLAHCLVPGFVLVLHNICKILGVKVKASEREKQEEERSQTQNEENRHATRHQVFHSLKKVVYYKGSHTHFTLL